MHQSSPPPPPLFSSHFDKVQDPRNPPTENIQLLSCSSLFIARFILDGGTLRSHGPPSSSQTSAYARAKAASKSRFTPPQIRKDERSHHPILFISPVEQD